MSSSSYSRLGYAALKVETTENVAVKPNTFVPIMKEDIVPKYDVSISMPIAANRTLNLHGVPNAIPAPSGKVSVNVEAKTFGHFLKGVYGTVSTGRWMPTSSVVGTFVVGETVTGGTSGKTAVIIAISSEGDYLLTAAFSGAFTTGETITGGTSGATAVIGITSNTVYGHQFVAPQTSLPTYTVEFGYLNEAVRLTGARFHEITVNQKDNIITADITLTGRAEYKHAYITAITTAGAGAKTINCDQTTGLVVGDLVKLFRPSTGAFLDFSAASVLTNTIVTIPGETSITVTNLQTSIAVGDLLILAPQTTSYSTVNEFTWIGGSTLRISETSITAARTATAQNIEEFEVNLQNGLEGRHAANGANVVNRFPANNFLKGLKGNGKLKQVYVDMTFLDQMRKNRPFSLYVQHIADQISTTGIYYTLDFRAPTLIYNGFNPTLEHDSLLDQDMPYEMFFSASSNFFHKAVLVNDVTSY